MGELFPQLTDEEEAVYKWQYGYGGDFSDSLMRLIGQADIENQARLAMGFPVEVRAYQRFANEDGWWQAVLHKARGG